MNQVQSKFPKKFNQSAVQSASMIYIFEKSIDSINIMEDKVVVLTREVINRNAYCFDRDGRPIWQIPASSFDVDDEFDRSFYVSAESGDDGTIYLNNFRGFSVQVDVNSGQIINEKRIR